MGLRHIEILQGICDIVADELNGRSIKPTEHSFFLEEITDVEPPERQQLLREYVCNTVVHLLIGVQDQVRSLGAALNVGSSVTPFILWRTILEYSYKIAYLADPAIDPRERILRFLRIYFDDIRVLEKLPATLRPSSGNELTTKRKQQATEWYLELTGRDLRQVSAQEILDAVWRSGQETWPTNAGNENPIYQKGYRVGSGLVHGHSWAIRHYCLETQFVGSNSITIPRLEEETIRNLLLVAAVRLTHSFGFVCQLMHILPASAMNKLEAKIAEIRDS